MATIWDDSNHSPGESFKLASKARSDIKRLFPADNMIKQSESQYNSSKRQSVINITKTGKETRNSLLFYFKHKTTCYKVIADKNLSSSFFTWTTKEKSTDRNKLTILKELASLEMMLMMINKNKIHSDSDKLAKQVSKNWGFKEAEELFREVYYYSASKHAKLTKKLNLKTGKYEGERQQEGEITKKIYDIAKKLTSKNADNWNPSDVWLICSQSKKQIISFLSEIESDMRDKILPLDDIAYKFKDGLDSMLSDADIVGVSLKQVAKGEGSSTLIQYETIKKKSSKMDFSVLQSVIRTPNKGLPAYGELRTASKFNIKWGGRASATKANINLEGQMAGSTHQLGAIDAKVVSKMASSMGMSILRDSDFGVDDAKTIAGLKKYLPYVKKNHKDIHKQFVGKLTPAGMLSQYGQVECKRFVATISVTMFIESLNTEEILNMFLLAKKVDKVNPNYYLFE